MSCFESKFETDVWVRRGQRDYQIHNIRWKGYASNDYRTEYYNGEPRGIIVGSSFKCSKATYKSKFGEETVIDIFENPDRSFSVLLSNKRIIRVYDPIDVEYDYDNRDILNSSDPEKENE